ncbi:type II toxin-antitoxin system HicB family antitoxin [Methylobacterium nonmethylotrophicum]|uniref:HicB family protein n=1 Tax=Methylobacterium nonmethylotrophicum TaxID=1141884 RepID=A0A4Z0NG65_9HYPH|nr:type II toxin-antitoxin system HicB family antitoxin [Methylobacterium nonmethylotrophicum]TGD94611.1 HicB family protein [Methylobacterium nonmethylotrophicum]
MHYIAFLHPPEGGPEWGVTFPDLPGCVSGGKTFEAAIEGGREALSGHPAVMRADGDSIPAPRSFAEFSADPEAMAMLDGGLVQIIAPDPAPDMRVRLDLMIDATLLRRTDAAAEARGMSRASFIEAELLSAAGP